MTNLQGGIVMGFGAVIALAGLWLLFTRNEAGANRLKILGQEFEISTPALVVFLVGSAIFVLPVLLPGLQNTSGAPGSNSPIARIFSGALSEEKEPNDSFSSANPITIGTTVRGQIAVKDDRDFFVFSTSSNPQTVLKIHLENNSMTLRPELTFYNGLKARIKKIYETTKGADLEMSSLTVPADSTFYVEVSSHTVYRSSGEYKITVAAE